MSIKELIIKSKGLWKVKLTDNSKWVVNLDTMMFDNYNWYSKMGTLESEFNVELFDDFISNGSWEKLKVF